MHIGAAWVQVPLVQVALWQSALTRQVSPSGQSGQLPPQSMSVSLPFLRLSMQFGWAVQVPLVHRALWQSALTMHVSPLGQAAQVGPPQSMSVSLPFLIESLQVGCAAHRLFWHRVL